MTRQSMSMVLGVTVGFLALIGVGPPSRTTSRSPTTPASWVPDHRGCARGPGRTLPDASPFQFVRRIRSRHLAYHRRTGRILVAIGLVVGATALFMGLVIPFSGWGRG